MRKWDRYCVKCFWNLEDTDVRCRHCGHDYVKLHIRIAAIHKKDSHNFKDRKLWIGKTGEFIIDTDYKYVENSVIGAGWYGVYFIPDESPSETWLHNAIQFIEVQQPALAFEEKTKSATKQQVANKKGCIAAGIVFGAITLLYYLFVVIISGLSNNGSFVMPASPITLLTQFVGLLFSSNPGWKLCSLRSQNELS